MIYIKKILIYFKILGIFILLEVLISFLLGLFNLLGMNSSLSKIILLIINLGIFFTIGFTQGKITNKKGIIEGALTGFILTFILLIISLIFFHASITFLTFIYYLSLIFVSILGSTIGKNKKIDSTSAGKK